ncbi:MAG: hypothetical protein FWD86_01580 [Firmicutes bacterium]|nr:hypothetical protein [Bacillota bacterium]
MKNLNPIFLNHNQKKQMLKDLDKKDIDSLFDEGVFDIRHKSLDLSGPYSHQQIIANLSKIANQNTVFSTILRGGGISKRFVPPVVSLLNSAIDFCPDHCFCLHQSNKTIFKILFDLQKTISLLSGLPSSSTLLDSGAIALLKTILSTKADQKNTAIIFDSFSPHLAVVIKTIIPHAGMDILVLPNKNGQIDYDILKSTLIKYRDKVACVCFEQVNRFGLIEESKALCHLIRQHGAKSVVWTSLIHASVLQSVGSCGGDFAVGSLQDLGLDLALGGLDCGFVSSGESELNYFNHIKKSENDEKISHNNEKTENDKNIDQFKLNSLCQINISTIKNALKAASFLNSVGGNGLKKIALTSASAAHYAADEFVKNGAKLKYGLAENGADFFDRFVATHRQRPSKILKKLAQKSILGGSEVGEHDILWQFDENITKEKIDLIISVVN